MKIPIDKGIYYPIIKRLCVDTNYNGTCPFDHMPLVKQIAKIQSKTEEGYDCYLQMPVMMCPKCTLIYISLVSYYHLIEKANTVDFFYFFIEPNEFIYLKEQYYGSGAPISNDSKWFQIAKSHQEFGVESVDLKCSKRYYLDKDINPKIVQKKISDYESNRKYITGKNGKPVIKTYNYVEALDSKDEPLGLQREIKVVDEAELCPECHVATTTIQTILNPLCDGKPCDRKLLTSLRYCLKCDTYLMDKNTTQRLMDNLNPIDDCEFYSIKICNGIATKRNNNGLQKEIKVVDEAKVCPDCHVATITIKTKLNLLCDGEPCDRKLLTSLHYCLKCDTYLMDKSTMQRLMVSLNPTDGCEFYSIKICNGIITKRSNYLNSYGIIKAQPAPTQETLQRLEELRTRYSTGTDTGEMQVVYLYKNKCRCLYCLREFNHDFIKSEQIKIKTFSGNIIPAQVSFCTCCGRRFLNEDMYSHYTREHGALCILAQRMDDINSHFSTYNPDSILSQCGYYVSIDKDPGETNRREILRMIISKGLATKAYLIELLTSFIKGRSDNQFRAKEKWDSDREYLYNLPADINNSSRVYQVVRK